MFTIEAVLPWDTPAGLVNIYDLEILNVAGMRYLFSASRDQGTISIFRIDQNAEPTLLQTDSDVIFTGSLAMPDLTVLRSVDGLGVLHIDQSGDAMETTTFSFSGSMSQTQQVNMVRPEDAPGVPAPPPIDVAINLIVAGNSFLVASNEGVPGLQVWGVHDGTTLIAQDQVADSPTSHLGDVVALTTCELDGVQYVFAASGVDAGVTSYRLNADGSMDERSTIGTDDGLWVSAPTQIQSVKSGDGIYLIVGAAGSSSLSVLEVTLGGHLWVVDHVIDEAASHFRNLSALEVVPVGERALVFAGGSDDGISMFELDADGQLHFVTSITDPNGVGFSDVTAIRGTVLGDELQLFVSNSLGGQASRTTIDLADMGFSFSGGQLNDTITGTAANDIILGRDGNDTLDGGDGADRIVDGRGSDQLTGGSGADVFVMSQDGTSDTITDFQDGSDQIDLSDWPLLHEISRLSISQSGSAVVIQYFDEQIVIMSQDGPLDVTDIDSTDFIF